VQSAEGKALLSLSNDSTCSSASTAPASSQSPNSTRLTAWEFLQHLLKTVRYHIHTIPTDNGIQFAEQQPNRIAI
jgi:hypothetical protein